MAELFTTAATWDKTLAAQEVEVIDYKASLAAAQAAIEKKVPELEGTMPVAHSILIRLARRAVLDARLPSITICQTKKLIAKIEMERYPEGRPSWALSTSEPE